MRVSTIATFVALVPLAAAAQGGDTVTVGQQVKRAFGTVTGMTAGDVACYLKLKDDRGAAFDELAAFDVCEQRSLIGKRVALSYVVRNVMSPDCQGDPACKKTRSVVLVSAARPATAPPASPAAKPRSSFCTADETIVFSCRTSSRLISVCASKGATAMQGYLQYRYGKSDSAEPPEIVLPESKIPPSKAAIGDTLSFSGGGGAWLRFTIGHLSSTVYTAIGKFGPKGEIEERAGMLAERQGKAVASLKCVTKPVSELGPDWFARVGIKADGQDFDLPD